MLAVGFVLRMTVFLLALRDPQLFYLGDGAEYWDLGQHFAEAYGNTHSPFFDLGLLRTPGYPAVIAALTSFTGDRESVVVFTQILVSLATIVVLYVLVRDLRGTRAALFAAAFLAVDPISVVMPSYLQPETVFAFLFLAATLLLERAARSRSPRLFLAAGATFGASVLVRPVALYAWIVIVPLVWLLCRSVPWRRRLLNSGIVALAFLLPVAGWIVRNERTTGVAVLSTVEGRDLLRFRAANALAFDTGRPSKQVRRELVQKLERETAGDSAAEYSRAASAEAIRTLLDHPVGAAVTTARGAGRLLLGPGRAELLRLTTSGNPNHLGGARTVVVALEFVILGALLLTAACGLVVSALRRDWKTLAIAGGLGGYLILVASGGAAYSRYRAPAAPFLALAAGIGCDWLVAEITRRRARSASSDAHLSESPEHAAASPPRASGASAPTSA